MLKGITVKLYERTQTGTDPLNQPIYSTTPVEVDNVLVAPANVSELPGTTDLNGAKEIYTLGLPKDDNHSWYDCDVEFFGQTFHTVGLPLRGIEDLIPLDWNDKVTVARYE